MTGSQREVVVVVAVVVVVVAVVVAVVAVVVVVVAVVVGVLLVAGSARPTCSRAGVGTLC